MFRITQVPQVPPGLGPTDFTVAVDGPVLTVNGEEFDFSFMEEGSYLPFSAVGSPLFFERNVERDDDGTISLALYVPVSDPTEPLGLLEGSSGTLLEVRLPGPTEADAPQAHTDEAAPMGEPAPAEESAPEEAHDAD